MTLVITLREPIVFDRPDPEAVDPEDAIAAARWAGYADEVAGSIGAVAARLPLEDEDGQPFDWSIRNIRHLRFLRRLVAERRLERDTAGSAESWQAAWDRLVTGAAR